MVKYKINLNFKDNGNSLSEIITQALKIEIENKLICNNFKMDLSSFCTNYFKTKRINN